MPGDLHEAMAGSHPSLSRGMVWCRSCGSSRSVKSADALRYGWPKCCGVTMTIDSPEEQAALRRPDRQARPRRTEGDTR